MTRSGPEPFEIGGTLVAPGTRAQLEFPVARLPGESNPQMLPCVVIHGREPGPVGFVSAAVHGDEVNGTAIIRRLIDRLKPKTMAGTVMLVPVVNLFGFMLGSRYLPDRRDLNRCFPGSRRGSLASRMAHLFMEEIVARADYGVDLHTGSHHRTNAPQIRANLDDPKALELATAFGTGLAIHAKQRPGSLRQACAKLGVPALTMEAGEALRFDANAVEVGVRGVERLVACRAGREIEAIPTLMIRSSKWLRAKRSGLFWSEVRPGDHVSTGQIVGRLTDLLGDYSVKVKSPADGVVLGLNLLPTVHQGDALLNLGFLPVD